MSEAAIREQVILLIDEISAHDPMAAEHQDLVRAWIRSGSPLWRTQPPAVPPMHLVAYTLPFDPRTGRYLLVEHRKAGLLLPPGGHLDPLELPEDAARRELAEELRLTTDEPI